MRVRLSRRLLGIPSACPDGPRVPSPLPSYTPLLYSPPTPTLHPSYTLLPAAPLAAPPTMSPPHALSVPPPHVAPMSALHVRSPCPLSMPSPYPLNAPSPYMSSTYPLHAPSVPPPHAPSPCPLRAPSRRILDLFGRQSAAGAAGAGAGHAPPPCRAEASRQPPRLSAQGTSDDQPN